MIIKACFNQPLGHLLTGLSIVGAALALSARESLENLIASFIIFFDKPFFSGDTVKVNNITGTVEKIGLRSTRILTTDKTLVTVPNKQMVDSIVDNWSMRNTTPGRDQVGSFLKYSFLQSRNRSFRDCSRSWAIMPGSLPLFRFS
jgi:MscS family membrane protein